MMEIEDVGTTKRGRLTQRMKLSIWEREHGKCMICQTKLTTGRFIFEHVRALELGGEDKEENIRLTCLGCAKTKTQTDHKTAAKAKRQKANYLGLKKSRTPLPAGKHSKWKRKLNGQVVLREE